MVAMVKFFNSNRWFTTNRFLKSLFCVAVFSLTAGQSIAAVCADVNSDPDGDGWGWENGASCEVSAVAYQSCNSPGSDPDGDGWGWESGATCLAGTESLFSVPYCSTAVPDFDLDGWGMENGNSCLVRSNVAASSNMPSGVRFDLPTLRRVGGKGDNWCQTWAADDSIITAMDDGDWFSTEYRYHSRLYRLYGDQNNFSRHDVPGYPRFHTDDDGWFAYGMLSASGTLYSMVSKTQTGAWSEGPFRGVKMLRSYDNGSSWNRVDQHNNERAIGPWDSAVQSVADSEMFFGQEFGRTGSGKTAYPFSFVSFVQSGRDHSASKDGYVYIYSPEGSKSNELLLARVPEAQVGQRSAWQYFSGWDRGTAMWSGDINQRQPNLNLPDRNSHGEYFGWYSWLPSVVWNPGLQLYVMANGGTYGGNFSNSTADYYDKWMHNKSGSLGLWYSETPYGPWNQFFYTDYWTPDNPANLTYQPKLSPKWISEDGKKMVLIWSDAQRNAQGYSHNLNYKWNQMEIEIQTR